MYFNTAEDLDSDKYDGYFGYFGSINHVKSCK